MTAVGLVAFNLLLNGVAAFALAWVVARGALALFRAGPGRAHVALVALPFAKLAVTLAGGVPAGSFIWLRARGVPQDLGSFRVGLGVWWGIPELRAVLGALSAGKQYSQSAADLLAAFLTRRGGAWVPAVIAGSLLTVGAVRLAQRAMAWRRAFHERRAVRSSASLVGRRRIGWRSVAILVSAEITGSPFTGGIVAPYVCFPMSVWRALRPEERRAALAHELGHVADHHVLVITLVGVVRDVFWFVPFIGAAERRLVEACELAADGAAVRRGAPPAVLASALVRVRETTLPRACSATLAAHESSLPARVARLLEGSPRPRLGFQHAWLRPLLVVWVATVALRAIAFGNY